MIKQLVTDFAVCSDRSWAEVQQHFSIEGLKAGAGKRSRCIRCCGNLQLSDFLRLLAFYGHILVQGKDFVPLVILN